MHQSSFFLDLVRIPTIKKKLSEETHFVVERAIDTILLSTEDVGLSIRKLHISGKGVQILTKCDAML